MKNTVNNIAMTMSAFVVNWSVSVFILPQGASFYDLYEKRNEANIGELINISARLN